MLLSMLKHLLWLYCRLSNRFITLSALLLFYLQQLELCDIVTLTFSIICSYKVNLMSNKKQYVVTKA